MQTSRGNWVVVIINSNGTIREHHEYPSQQEAKHAAREIQEFSDEFLEEPITVSIYPAYMQAVV